jgi:hypothetical protein
MRLTRDEIILIASILLTLVLGAVVKQYRTQRREAAVVSATAVESGARTTRGR